MFVQINCLRGQCIGISLELRRYFMLAHSLWYNGEYIMVSMRWVCTYLVELIRKRWIGHFFLDDEIFALIPNCSAHSDVFEHATLIHRGVRFTDLRVAAPCDF